ncbi:hypothetical protein FRC19_011776 [Serendipita sp. 401]|nr:hypothetical protein FRC19_011776 [Serendipita sp. 401]
MLVLPRQAPIPSVTKTGKPKPSWEYVLVEDKPQEETPLPAKRMTALRKSNSHSMSQGDEGSRRGEGSVTKESHSRRRSEAVSGPSKQQPAKTPLRRTRSTNTLASDEEVDSPTKNVKAVVKRQKFTTPKRRSRLSAASSQASQASDSEEESVIQPSRRPPARPKKGRPSYNAKVRAAPGLDLYQSDASSGYVSEDRLVGGIVPSTPMQNTDTECSGTESNLTPASVAAFTKSSPRKRNESPPTEDEMEPDDDDRIILDESVLPSQPTSPSKNAHQGPLPAHLHKFVQPQKGTVMRNLSAPAWIDVEPVIMGDKAIVEAPASQQLADLLKGTCERGEGNSCLLLGSRGCGKTLLLNTSLKNCTSNPIVIRLSGHTQSTDRLAMLEMAYQLKHQTGASINIPDEDEEEANQANDNDGIDFTPPAAYLPTLISLLPTFKRPIVVVLDAFDLFAAHPRQALLYCLLDTVQSCRAGEGRNGLLVIGLTCVVNCVNLLEKRVKSRFSHRILKVPNPSSLEEYVQIARQLLDVRLDRNEVPMAHKIADLAQWNQRWRESVEVFLKSPTTRQALVEIYSLRCDIGNLARSLLSVVRRFDISSPWLSATALDDELNSQFPDKFEFMYRLPQSTMWILVAIYQWGTTGHDLVNLRMILDACTKAAVYQDSLRMVVTLAGEIRAGGSVAMPAMTLRAAFEELVAMKVLIATTTNLKGTTSPEFVKYNCMVDRHTIRRVVEKAGSTTVKNWLVTASTVNT